MPEKIPSPQNLKSGPTALPAGFHAVPALPGQDAAPLRLCLIVRKDPDPVAGHLVVLRDTLDARALLGCVTDAGGRVHRWVEMWVQSPQSLAQTPPAHREFLTNAVLDDRWRRQCDAFDQLEPPGLLRTGFETRNPPPTFIDLDALAPAVIAAEGAGQPWTLCKDDALLAAKSLPAYGASLARYLYRPGAADGSPLIATHEDCPANDATRPLAQLLTPGKVVPLNPAAGLLMVRPYHLLSYEQFADLLAGIPTQGATHGTTPLGLIPHVGAATGQDQRSEDGRFFSARRGRAGMMIETLHLKLRLVAGALDAVRALVAHTQRPVLNLTADSFAVSAEAPAPGLPHLWTSRVHLNDPGDAIALDVPGTAAQYFVRARSAGASVYRAATVDEPAAGYGSLRVREVRDDARGIVLVGTFTAQERIGASPSDLIWLRLNLGSGPLDIYAHLEPDRAPGAKPLAVGEWRIRTLPHALPEAIVKALRAPQGYSFGKVYYQLLPLLSTPCDLYSLAVLAVRTLFVTPKNPLSFAWDEAMSLAAQVAAQHAADVPVQQRVATLFDAEPRWANSLGPQQLLADQQLTPADALAVIPRELWFETLASVVRMFPGVGPDSFCRDFGHATPNAIHQVFDAPLEAMRLLLLRTTSLLLADWNFNREVTRLLKRQLTTLPGGQGS
jgi:hypothetical protein